MVDKTVDSRLETWDFILLLRNSMQIKTQEFFDSRIFHGMYSESSWLKFRVSNKGDAGPSWAPGNPVGKGLWDILVMVSLGWAAEVPRDYALLQRPHSWRGRKVSFCFFLCVHQRGNVFPGVCHTNLRPFIWEIYLGSHRSSQQQ